MHLKSAVMLRVMLNYYHQRAFEPLLKFLPPENQQEIANQKIASQDISAALVSPIELLKTIHYSWLVAPIQKFSPQMQTFMLSSLAESVFAKLNRILCLPIQTPYRLAKPLQTYFKTLLYKELDCDSLMPVPFFTPAKLNFLTEWKKQDLVELVDYLGLYDLANFVRQIIDKIKLKAIYDCLNNDEKHFMRLCFHTKDKIVLPPIELANWDGDRKKLYELVHRRGLLRLGKALSNESPDLIWLISRIFDKGRGTILFNHTQQKTTPAIAMALTQQIENSINFIKTKSTSE